MGQTRRWIDPRTRIPWVVSVRSLPSSERAQDDPEPPVIVVFASVDGLWTVRERLEGTLDELEESELQRILDRAVEGRDWVAGDRDLRPSDSA